MTLGPVAPAIFPDDDVPVEDADGVAVAPLVTITNKNNFYFVQISIKTK